MPEQEKTRDSSSRVQIIIALIGLAGVIATAFIANWSNIFPKKPATPTPNVTSSATPTSGIGKKSERPVHSSGRLIVRGTYSYDLDAGVEINMGGDLGTERTGGDFQWEIVDTVRRFVTPANGAAFFVVGGRDFESIRWSEMEHFPYSTGKIRADSNNSNQIPAGTVVAYKTNEGRLGKFIVDQYGYNLTIRWRTYD
jgi:hypothetical protein